jgi:hypothetical protein
MAIYVTLLFAIAGLLVYAFAANPKLAEAGRIAYFAGLLAFLIGVAPHMAKLLGP